MSYRYICWGDSAAGALKMRNKLASQQHEVYPFVDDLRFGPMEGLEDGSKLSVLAGGQMFGKLNGGMMIFLKGDAEDSLQFQVLYFRF